MNKEGKWMINLSEDEIWTQPNHFDSKEKAIAFGKTAFNELFEEENGEKFNSELYAKEFYVGQIVEYQPHLNTTWILEQVADQAYDEVGEVAEGFLENISKEEFGFLEERLNNAFNDWLEETKNKPTFFKIIDVEKVRF